MMLNAVPQTHFKALMEVQKTIPSYQRDFVWEAEDILLFVESIEEAFTENRDAYFCGSMVLFRNSQKIYEIVDGQQRTTVIFVLLAALINKLPEDTFKSNYRQNLLAKEQFQRQTQYNFTHKNGDIMKFIEDVTFDKIDRNSLGEETLALRTLYDSYETISSFVDVKFSEDNPSIIHDLILFVTEKCFVVHYLAEDMADALLTYSRLNSGGKKLGHLEVVKGLTYASAERQREEWEPLEDAWTAFWDTLTRQYKIGGNSKDKPKEIIKQETFISYFLMTYYPKQVNDFCGVLDGFPPASKLIDFLQSTEAKKSVFENPRKLLKQLTECINKVKRIRTGEHPNVTIANYYKDIALLSQSQTQPLTFILAIAESDFLQNELLEYVFRLTFIFTTSVTGSGSTSGTWRTLAKQTRELEETDLSDSEKVEKIKSLLLDKIKEFHNSNFVDFISKQDIFSSSQQLRKTLRVLELVIRRNSKVAEKSNYSDWYGERSVDIDHIHPKNLIADDSEFTNMIGNAALLNTADNRGVKDKPFDSIPKQNAYKRSEYFHARAIVSDNTENDANGSHKEAVKSLKQHTVFDDQVISERNNEIKKLFEEYLIN